MLSCLDKVIITHHQAGELGFNGLFDEILHLSMEKPLEHALRQYICQMKDQTSGTSSL